MADDKKQTSEEQIKQLQEELEAQKAENEKLRKENNELAPFKPVKFEAQVTDGDKKVKKKYEIIVPKFIVPAKGNRPVTAAQAAEDPEILAELVSKNSGVIREVQSKK